MLWIYWPSIETYPEILPLLQFAPVTLRPTLPWKLKDQSNQQQLIVAIVRVKLLVSFCHFLLHVDNYKKDVELNPIWHGLFWTVSYRRGGLHHNVVVIAPKIMKFGTGIKLDVFYTMVTKHFVTSLLLRNYDVITCILAVVFRCS